MKTAGKATSGEYLVGDKQAVSHAVQHRLQDFRLPLAALLGVVRAEYRPLIVAALGGEASSVPLLDGRPMIDGHATAYVCRDFVCRLPITTPADLGTQL